MGTGIPDFDLYRELEVHLAASTETIEAAYRSLIRRHHPDVWGDAQTRRVQRLNVAREWLTDPSLRRRYDELHRRPLASSSGVGLGSTAPLDRRPSTASDDGHFERARMFPIVLGIVGASLVLGPVATGIGASVVTVAAFALGLVLTVYASALVLTR